MVPRAHSLCITLVPGSKAEGKNVKLMKSSDGSSEFGGGVLVGRLDIKSRDSDWPRDGNSPAFFSTAGRNIIIPGMVYL
jgi:hypothetical protein